MTTHEPPAVAAHHKVEEVRRALLRAWPLPGPSAQGDKEERGCVLVVAGSREMAGAAMLAGVCALRAGAGKLVIATSRGCAPWLSIAVPEARVIGLPDGADGAFTLDAIEPLREPLQRADALLLGPGMQGEAGTVAFVTALLAGAGHVPVVLDALAIGALSALAGAGRPQRVLITPHAGEMAHLTGASKAEVVAEPLPTASRAAARWRTVVALKGAVTWIATPRGDAWRHAADVPGLATSGSGDALAGLVAGLVARGASLEQAACWGAAVHAAAGRRAAARLGRLGYLAGELGAEVPGVLQELAG